MKHSLTGIICLLSSFVVHAQFGGGIGDGHDQIRIVQTRMNGNPGGDAALFQGGAGDGFTNRTQAGYLNGIDLSAIYSGGRGDGVDHIVNSLTVSGTNLAALYTGGIGDGFDRISFNGYLNNISTAVLYSGGSGDGFDTSLFNGAITGVRLFAIYSGGIGDGVDYRRLQGYLNGESLSTLYSGGINDGWAKTQFSGNMAPEPEDIVVPIELISFDATAKETYVLVKWVTASEKDNDFYTVERSSNGVLFDKLVDVPGQGNSTAEQTYSINDEQPLQGRSYYRLKWTDYSGRAEYSVIRSVLFNSSQSRDFLLFPNPTQSRTIQVQLSGYQAGEAISLSVRDLQGRIIYQQDKAAVQNNQISLQLPAQLARGSYVVEVWRDTEKSSKVLVIQ